MDEYKTLFEQNFKLDSLLALSLAPTEIECKKELITNNSWINPKCTNGLHMNNALYLYTNPPPYGYGTPAPKVAETVLRAYEYNRKKDDKSKLINNYNIEKTCITDLKDFPFDKTTGNFNPYFTKLMSTSFLSENIDSIRKTANEVIDWAKNANSDVLSMGNQTWDPSAEKSITNPRAFARVMSLFQENLNKTPTTVLEFYIMFLELFDLDVLKIRKREIRNVPVKKIYDSKFRTVFWRTKKKLITKTSSIVGEEEVIRYLLDHTRSFCSYIKHAERGKKDRRAIASPGIFMRLLLKIVEEFHLRISKVVKGSTISIGGEEKKRKILSELRSATTTDTFGETFKLQGTEDATKWNECLNPLMFGIVHYTFFNEETRKISMLPKLTEEEKLFKKMCDMCFFILSIKRIHLGPGVMISNDEFYTRKNWDEYKLEELNEKTKDWVTRCGNILESKNYLFSSPGFLMGMLNACSTTIGLLPSTFIKSNNFMVMTLRSSDDSMSVYMGKDYTSLLQVINYNYKLCKLLGINMSTAKTLLCPADFGEYTSWYQDGDFVGQAGVETSSLRPGGQNPQEDFNNIAIQTSILLRTYIINLFGATARLYIGVNNVRRLWRVKKTTTKFNITDDERFLTDGGTIPWNLENCFIDESTLRYFTYQDNENVLNYINKVMNPNNPFLNPIEEKLAFSRDSGTLTYTNELHPQNMFTFIKRSNNTVNNETSKVDAESEKLHQEAYEISCEVDPSFYLHIPHSKSLLSDHLASNLTLMASELQLTIREKDLVIKAVEKLQGVYDEGSDDDDEESGPDRKRIRYEDI